MTVSLGPVRIVATAMLLLGGAVQASAQNYYYRPWPPEPRYRLVPPAAVPFSRFRDELPPWEIETIVRSKGYTQVSRARLTGPVYRVHATDRRGWRVELVVDSATGRIVEREALGEVAGPRRGEPPATSRSRPQQASRPSVTRQLPETEPETSLPRAPAVRPPVSSAPDSSPPVSSPPVSSPPSSVAPSRDPEFSGPEFTASGRFGAEPAAAALGRSPSACSARSRPGCTGTGEGRRAGLRWLGLGASERQTGNGEAGSGKAARGRGQTRGDEAGGHQAGHESEADRSQTGRGKAGRRETGREGQAGSAGHRLRPSDLGTAALGQA